jgi:hypothetical protein
VQHEASVQVQLPVAQLLPPAQLWPLANLQAPAPQVLVPVQPGVWLPEILVQPVPPAVA